MAHVSLTPERREALKNACLNRFKHFCMTFIPEEWFDEGLHGDLCDFLQYSDAPDKLVIMARVHLKTTIAAIMFPLWKATRDPTIRTLNVKNSAINASKTLRAIRGFIDGNALYRALFPEVLPPRSARWNDECACLNRPQELPEGTFEAIGIGGNVTGRHYNLVIEDDTVTPQKDEFTAEEVLPSMAEIDKAVGWHRQTIPLLQLPIEEQERIHICTRWAHNDVAQYILNKELALDPTSGEPTGVEGGRYAVLDVPAIDSETGEPNYKKMSLKSLAAIRASLGPFMFNLLYLNRPLASEFMKFRPEWVRYYEDDDERYEKAMEDGHVIVTVDPADPPTGKKTQSYTAIVSCLQSKVGLFVRRFRQERYTDKEMIDAALDMADQDKALEVRIETDRYPHLEAAFRVAMASRGKYYVVRPVKTRGRNKDARIMRLQPLFENGLIFLKHGMSALENELFQFPRGATKDIIDALAWQVLEDFQVPDMKAPERPKRPKGERQRFSLEDIRGSLRSRHESKYPFPHMYDDPIHTF